MRSPAWPQRKRTSQHLSVVKADRCRQLYSWLGNSDLLIVKAIDAPPLTVLPPALAIALMLAAERASKMEEPK